MITRDFFAWNPIHKDHATLARSVKVCLPTTNPNITKEEPDKGSYMNCLALMNSMEVKMDQIQDGTLLDASQIRWYNNPDDDTPLPVLPAQAHRSTRIPCPAPKLVDPNNAVLRKRKASRSVVTSEGSEGESDCEGDQDNGVTTDAATDMDHETDIDGITPFEPASQ
ncbi:uncharacterized protein EDB93DRAFT_1248738 [Suillus bovinus]|uniref:uncharacterized protein n=1 Tax=Suillus bovinus TaxID=48563 RepID=UPI001B8715F4|nr:uncharacterized protein EDB93DRAFT_1248738 [Suillus bovinus]KAG2153473.1 hypothetical protein EDB93DRAFT_1248738 [Suillus bovinus]